MALNTNQKYSPQDLAQYTGGVGETWNGKEFFADGQKYVVRDNGDGSRSVQVAGATANDVSSGKVTNGNAKQILVDQISSQMIELEDKLSKIPGVTFTTDEYNAFMNKALDEITPYYDQKKAEIEKGIKEGKIQTGESTLALIARVQSDVKNKLASYDIDQAQTEEEFVNKLADITASSAEAVDAKRVEWKQRLDAANTSLTQKGIFTSGIGQKQITDLNTQKQQEFDALQRRTDQATTEADTSKKFSLERVSLARQAITDDRNRRIGAPTDTAALEAKARADAGLTPDQPIPSEAQIAYDQGQRNTKVYDPTALTSLEEERRSALEQTKLSIQKNEEDMRQSEYEAQRKQIQAEIAKKQMQINSYQ